MKLTNSTIGIVFVLLISSGLCIQRTEKVERKVTTDSKLKKGKASSTTSSQSTAESIRTQALNTLKSKGATKLSYNEWKGWITENNDQYSIFDFDVSDVFTPQTILHKRGMVFRLNNGESLKGKMSQVLEQDKSNTYLIPFRKCGPITLYNPYIKRKYYETTCKGVNIKFTFAYLDIENSEWILLQQELEKNRTNRLTWLNQKISDCRTFGNEYLEAKKSLEASKNGKTSLEARLDAIKSEKTVLETQKTTETTTYRSLETQLSTAKRTLGTHSEEREVLKTKSVGLTLSIQANGEALKTLEVKGIENTELATDQENKAKIANNEFENIIKLLKTATEEASLTNLTINDLAVVQRVISAI
jgi:hypothetical protein